VILSNRIALDPTVEQSIALLRACGVARFTWNWALAAWNKAYAAGEKTSANKLKLTWNKTKHTAYPWVGESPKDANQQPFSNLNTAFQRFFKKTAKRPTFKKKGQHDSFYVSNDKFTVSGHTVRLPVIGNVRLTEALRLTGKIMAGTVSREADRWFLSIQVEGDHQRPRTANGTVGIDLGLKTALVLSDGTSFDAPKPLKANLRRLKRRARQHSRKQKGSQNRKKSQCRLARCHARIKHIRRDWQHKVTTQVCRENQTIALEDLNVKGMTKNHCLARAINDVGFYELRRQFEYKALRYGSRVVIINRWLPTSKTCSNCACKKDVLALSERVFHCDHCGFEIDRDLNAAINIRTAGLAGINACRPEGSGPGSRKSSGTKPRRAEAGTKPRAHSCVLTN
jgi:putative transposase